MPAKTLILIGPSGVGKSLIGAQLAKKLGRVLLDIDQNIEAHSGVDISWIFDKEGEAGFRERELAALKRGMSIESAIIVTGAGIVTTPACRELIRQPQHLVIHLSAPAWLLYQRLENAGNRPMLADSKGEDRLTRIEQMLEERMPYYEQLADYSLNCRGKAPNQLVRQILDHVQP